MKPIGILGGMGPLATLAFEQTLLHMVGAKKDQDYPPIYVVNDGTFPDRTAAIMNGDTSPVGEMSASIEKLKTLGAEVICIPCNTAHAFYDELKPTLEGAQFAHIVDGVRDELAVSHTGVARVGVMGTVGTKAGRAYNNILGPAGYEVIYPDDKHQALVSDAIYGEEGIKAGGIDLPKKQLEQVVEHLKESGAQVVVLGCTELPIALKQAALPLIDSNQALAALVLKMSKS